VSKALRSLYDAGHFQQLSEVAAALADDVGWLWLDILAARYSSEEMYRQYVNALFMGSDEEVHGARVGYSKAQDRLQTLLQLAVVID
jgi:hypothetical protein